MIAPIFMILINEFQFNILQILFAYPFLKITEEYGQIQQCFVCSPWIIGSMKK